MSTDIRHALRVKTSHDQMEQRKLIFFDYMDSCVAAGCTPEQAWQAFLEKNSGKYSNIAAGIFVGVCVISSMLIGWPFVLFLVGSPFVYIMFYSYPCDFEESSFYKDYKVLRGFNN